MEKKLIFIPIIVLIFVILLTTFSACFLVSSVQLKGASSLNVKIGEQIDLGLSAVSHCEYSEEEILANIEYSSSDDSVVKIENGEIISVGLGEAIVRASWTVDSTIFFESNIFVLPTSLENARIIEPDTTELSVGDELELQVEYKCYYETKVIWFTSDSEIATIKDGKLKVIREGEFTVTAQFSNVVETVERTLTFTAKVKTYSIIYILEGGSNDNRNPQTYTEGNTVELYPATKEGYKFLGWYYNDTLFEQINEDVKGDIVLTAKYEYIPKTYSITYVLEGGKNDNRNPQTYTEGNIVELYPATKEGYKFLGWYYNDTLFEQINEDVKGEIVLTAKFEYIPKTYSITYVLEGGKNDNRNPQTNTEGNIVELYPATKEGYKFLGWYYNDNLIEEINEDVKGDIVLTAKYEYIPKTYSITYILEGGSNDNRNPQTYTEGNTVELYPATKEGYKFLGWYYNDTLFEQINEDVKGDIVLTAKYEYIPKTYSITYILEGGSNDNRNPQTYIEGNIVELYPATKEGYKFLGWYYNDTLFEQINEDVKGYVILTAKFEYIPKTYSITYILEGGSNDNRNPQTYTEGNIVELYPATKEGYKFLGWYYNDNLIEQISEDFKGDIILFANYEEILEFTICYNYNEGYLPNIKPNSLSEFSDVFWQEFYSWSRSNEGLETFKANAFAKWKDGNDGGYKVYKQSGRNEIDDDYFINSEGNERWRTWMDVFDSKVTEINSSQTAWESTYVGYIRLYTYFNQTSIYWTEERTKAVYSAYTYNSELVTTFKKGESKTLTELVIDDGRIFLGWYDESGTKITKTDGIIKDLYLTARWSEKQIPFVITNAPERIYLLNYYQLTWNNNPAFGNYEKIKFTSSDSNILTIDINGKIYGANLGFARITATCGSYSISFDVQIYIDPFINAVFNPKSVIGKGETTNIVANIISGDGTLSYISNNPSVATVDSNGVVYGENIGYAEIEVYLVENRTINLVLGVTVTSVDIQEVFEIIENAHNSDIYVVRGLDVAYVYQTDVFTSVSDLLFNYSYSVDDSLLMPVSSSTKATSRPGTKISNLEFITVHYTAGTGKSFNAKATAQYFNSITSASANYCTGNDGIYMVIPDGEVSWHAGDGTNVKFSWSNTKVVATANVKPEWGVEKNSKSSTGYYFTINGQNTLIEVPISGKNSSGATVTLKDPLNAFTFYGPAWKIVDGFYYIGTTWACFTQVSGGVISSKGGNLNSVGIETACNKGSDLWLTYQITAQLVARLLVKYDLDTTRVVGHNMFSGKDCPQTLLANNGELWYKFMECVEAEYELYKILSNYDIQFESNNSELVDNRGRILQIPDKTVSVSYTVTVTNKSNGEVCSEKFSTVIQGRYSE